MIRGRSVRVEAILDVCLTLARIPVGPHADFLAQVFVARDSVTEVAGNALLGHGTKFKWKRQRLCQRDLLDYGGHWNVASQTKGRGATAQVPDRLLEELPEDRVRDRPRVIRSSPLLIDLHVAESTFLGGREVLQL